MKTKVGNTTTYVYTGARELVSAQDTIVFVHGAGLDHSVWLLQSRYFAHHGHNVLTVDLPGHGQSQGSPLPTIQAMAGWVLQVMDSARVERAAVVGHSMGSLVALEIAAQASDRVTALALLGACVPMPVTEQLLTAAKTNDHAAIDMINVWGHGRSAQIGGNPVPGMWMSGHTMRLLERARPGVLYNDLNACNEYRAGSDSAQRLRCPVLIMLARNDRMTPAREAQALIDQIGNVRSVVLNDCGHQMMAEHPDLVLDGLREFFASISRSVA